MLAQQIYIMAEIGVDIEKAQQILDGGGLVSIPTETVYGLGGNALDPAVVAQIFSVKRRPFFDPLIIHIGNTSQIKELVGTIPPAAWMLAEKFWPGPLTIIFSKKEIVPDIVTGGLPTVALRMPNHPITTTLLKKLAYPLAAPSANPFGYVSPTTAQHVQEQLGDAIPYILDGGPCKIGIESTIISLQEKTPTIYRKGGISLQEIVGLLGPVSVLDHHATPLAPGMMGSHYAPGKKLYLGPIEELLPKFKDNPYGVLTLDKKYPEIPPQFQVRLSSTGDLKEAAQNLFAALRKLDAMPITYILAEPVPDVGLGQAINDRLQRAAVNFN